MRAVQATALATLTALVLGCTGEAGSPEGLDAGSALGPAARGPVLNFTAPLEGEQEVPPVETKGTGVAKFQLSKDGTELSYKLISSNIDGVTQSHIHVGAAGVNGPVVVFLFGFVADGVSPNGVLAQGTITASDLVGPLAGMPLSVLLAEMEAGNTYVNVHTIANPGGEIRGQIDRGNGVRGN